MTSPTQLALLTPPGVGAIAVLALRGPAAWSIVRDLTSVSLPAEPTPGQFWLRRLGESGRKEADDVVISLRRAGPSPWVELHCHGGREVVAWLEELLAVRGATLCSWQDLEQAEAPDPFQVAALDVLASAPTARTAAIALDQYRGAFARAVSAVQTALTNADVAEATRVLADLERLGPVGRHLVSPYHVVVAGAPNVGKSSLVNALAGYQRSVVAPTPGTTRDVVTTLMAVDGWPVEFADTAGWRDAGDPLEREGIARAQTALASADLCLWVVDSSTPPVWPPANPCRTRIVINKADLPAAWDVRAIGGVLVSAVTSVGMAELNEMISSALVPEPPASGAALPFSGKLAEGVTAVAENVRAGKVAEALASLEKLGHECD